MNPSRPPVIRLRPEDNVVVALYDLSPGFAISNEGVVCLDPIPAGHKVATKAIPLGAKVYKYGQIIGEACREIHPGEHVHTQNLVMLNYNRDYAIGSDVHPTAEVTEAERATFDGILRDNGQVATRNYIGVLCSVACSAPVTRYIAEAFRGDALKSYPNVDGVVALPHGTGCAMGMESEDMKKLQRSLAGLARHPNFGAVLIVGLGCEVNQINLLVEHMGLEAGAKLQLFNIQETGGTKGAVKRGVSIIRDMLPGVNDIRRRPLPASHLILGLECGGSDAYSGITANPAMGVAADLLVRHGGTAVLSETTEIYGAEHLLVRRAVNRQVGENLLHLIRQWQDYTARNGATINNNPSPGNKAGGLTTILEKSLGAAAKGGTTNLMAVYDYAESITAKGFVFMDTPGYDPASVTGMVAGGANVVCFTTGRGTIYGFKPTPVIKLATNTTLYKAMPDDMDINCGSIIDGATSVEEMGERIFRFILETASGRRTKSELNGIGDSEFVPWQTGPVL